MARFARSFYVSAAIAALVGCGGLANPDASIATVSGNLQGTVPSNTHVAIVWRAPSGGAYAVTNDTAVVNGAFSFDLEGPPDDSLFAQYADTSSSSTVGGSGSSSGSATATPGTVTNAGSSSGSAGTLTKGLRLLDTTVSGTVSAPLSIAIAGFVVYADKNGNGKLDITDANGDSPDTILGGSSDLVLVYLRDGSDLELEKLRDSAGQLPSRGYELAWVNKGRWLPLTGVDLTLGVSKLPSPVCGVSSDASSGFDVSGSSSAPSSGVSGSGGTSTVSADASTSDPTPTTDGGVDSDGGSATIDSGTEYYYPSPTDPNLSCSKDGYSFTYTCNCDYDAGAPVVTPPSTGLCSPDVSTTPEPGIACGCPYFPNTSITPGSPIPTGWPCVVADASDGGPDDAGIGTSDGGSAPTDASAKK